MAKKTQRDEDQPKTPEAAAKPPLTPRPGAKAQPTPQVPLSDLELSVPVEASEGEPLPLVEAAPDSTILARPMDEVPLEAQAEEAGEEVYEVGTSDVFLGEEVEETPATQAETPEPRAHESRSSDVLRAEDAGSALTGFAGARAQPTTDVAPAGALDQADEPTSALESTADVQQADLFDEPSAADAETLAAQEVEAALPDSGVKAEDDIFGTEHPEVSAPASNATDLAPAGSDVHVADENSQAFAEVVSPSDVTVIGRTSAATDIVPIDQSEGAARTEVAPLAEAAPLTDIASGDHIEDAPPSEIGAADLTAHAPAPLSDVLTVVEEVSAPASATAEIVEEPAPASDVFGVGEVVEEKASLSDESAAEEIVEEPAPASDVFGVGEVVEEKASLSDVFGGGEVINVTEAISDVFGVSAAASDNEPLEEAAPASGLAPFGDAVEDATPSSAVEVSEEFVEEAAPVSDVTDEAEAAEALAAPSDVVEASEAIEEAAPVSDIAIQDAGIEDAAPASDVAAFDWMADEAAPASDRAVAEAIVADAAPTSDVMKSDESPAALAPVSDVAVGEEIVGAAVPVSDVMKSDDSVPAAAPASDVALAEWMVEETVPVSDVAVAEEIVGEVVPISDVMKADESVPEAAPVSDVAAAEWMPQDAEPEAKALRADEAVVEPAPVSEDAIADGTPTSAVVPAADVVEETAPVSDLALADWLAAEPTPASDVLKPEKAVEAAPPLSDVAVSEAIAAAPVSDVLATDEVIEEAALVSEVLSADEVIEEAVPVSDFFAADDVVAEAAPVSEVLAKSEVIEEAAPVSDILAADEVIEEAAPVSEVLSADEVIEEAAPVSDFFAADDVVAEAAPLSEVQAKSAVIEDAAPVSEVLAKSDVIKAAAPVSDVLAAEEVIEEAAPVSDFFGADEVIEDAAPVSEVLAVDEVIEDAAPVSEVLAVDEVIEDAAPVSEVLAVDEVIEDAAPVSEVLAVDEVIEDAAPVSEVLAVDEVIEDAAPVSEVLAVDEVIEDAAPVSEVLAVDEVIEEAAPVSGLVLADDGVEEAAPVSEVLEFEEVIEEAAPLSGAVFADELVEEAAPASEIAAAEEILEEVAEAIEEPSSTTRKAEAVFGDEAHDTFVSGSERKSPKPAAVDLNATEFLDEPLPKEDATGSFVKPSEEVLDAEPARSGSSAVLFEEAAEEGATQPKSGVGKTKAADLDRTAAFDQTMAFEGKPPSSASKKGAPSSLVTEEEITSESDADDLQDMPEAEPEEAVALSDSSLAETTGPEPSVLFDDLIEDDVAEAEAVEAVEEDDTPPAKKKSKAPASASYDEEDAESIDFEEVVEAVEEAEEAEAIEAFEDDEEPFIAKKKGKTVAKATGEDIDLDALFAESEGEEAVEAEDADDAEAVEAVEDEAEPAFAEDEDALEAAAAEAFEDEDEKPIKKTSLAQKTALYKGTLADEDIEIAQDADEEQPKKKTSMVKKTALFKGTLDDGEAEVELDESADDERPSKKTKFAKKTAVPKRRDEDEDEIETDFDDEDDDTSAKRKKSKKDKRDRTTAAPAAGPGFVMRWAGRFFLMFFGMILLAGGVAGAVYFAPDETLGVVPEEYRKDIAAHIHKPPLPPVAKKVEERKPIDKLRDIMAAGDFKKVADDLAKAKDNKDELNLRGQARWWAYVKEQDDAKKPLDKDAKEVADAKADLEAADNKALIKQIDLTIERQAFADVLAEKQKVEKLVVDLSDVLAKGGLIADKAKLDLKMLPDVIKSLNDDRATLEVVNDILKEADFKTGEAGLLDLFEVIGALASDRSDLRKDVDAVNDVLKAANAKSEVDKGVLEIVEDRDKTVKDRDDLFDTLKLAFKELVDGKIVVDPKADARKDIVKGVQTARLKAESPLSIPLSQLGLSLGNIGTGTSKAVEQTFDMTKLFTELGFFQTREPFIQSPQQKMATYLALLQDRKENDAKKLAAISREADWVLSKESRSDDDARGQARYVQGLALRNQEKFAEARTAFEESVKMIPPGPKAGEWSKLAQQSLKELTDPHAYYIKRMDQFRGEENFDAALAEANVALKAIPEDARLNAHRALIRFELVRHKRAKVSPDDQKAIREDAEIVGKDEKLAAESSFLIGQLEDELGNMPEAEKLYKRAIKLHEDMKGPPDNAGKYRVALGRLLLKDRTEVPERKDEEKKIEEKKKDDDKKLEESNSRQPAADSPQQAALDPADRCPLSADGRLLTAVCCLLPADGCLLTVAQQQPDEVEDKETLERYKAVMDEANRLIGSTDPVLKGQGHMLLGQVYSKMGRRTEGLKEYAKGLGHLTEKTKLKPKDIDDLIELIENHPAFSQPDIATTLNPVMAERHFGEGIHLYWAKQYPEAEAQFRQAVKYYHIDARYQYYLGLSQLGQRTVKKRDAAIFSLEQGARLEAKAASTNPFAVREINASLERVQGDLRQFLNNIRYKVQMSELEEKMKAL